MSAPGAADPAAGAALPLTVAGVCIAFEPAGGLSMEPPAFAYPGFLGGAARRRIPVGVQAARRWPGDGDLATVFDTGDAWRLLAAGARRRLLMPDRSRPGGVVWQVDWSRPLVRAEARVDPSLVQGGRVRHLAQYPLDQVLLADALLDDGGLLLHAAGGVTPAGGVVFAGVSGAGKSTVTRALDGRPGFRFASDDRLFARRAGAGFELHGTPWAGDAGVALALRAPLDAVCFLRQARATGLAPLPARAALTRLLPVATLPWYDRERVGEALDLCAALVREVPCFELSFSRDGEALAGALEAVARAA